MTRPSDKWAKGKAKAAFNAVAQDAKDKMRVDDRKDRTDNTQNAGQGGGPPPPNRGDGSKEQGANQRGAAIHRNATKGPSLER